MISDPYDKWSKCHWCSYLICRGTPMATHGPWQHMAEGEGKDAKEGRRSIGEGEHTTRSKAWVPLARTHTHTYTPIDKCNQNKQTIAAKGQFSLLHSPLHRQMRSWPPTDNLPQPHVLCIVALHHLKAATVRPGHFSTQPRCHMGTALVRRSARDE